tara:strand:+ start:4098 stop:5249 length:1152 start_codon:yes stop_codon:yes gene_type:complete
MTRILPQHALGGMQKQTMDLCEGFVESGHRVTIFTTKRNDGVDFEKNKGIDVHYLSPSKPGYYGHGWQKACRKKIQQLHAESPIDVIHSQSLGARYVINWAKKNNIPIVSTWHGTSLTEISTFFASASKHPRFWHWLFIMPYRMLKQYLTMDLAVRRASKVITLVSPTLEKNMKLFAKNKVITIPNGITIPEEDKRNDNEKIEMICLGRIEKEKGMHFAVQAVSKLNEMDRGKVHLNIVGEGPYLESIRELIEHLELDQYISCHGRLNDENLDAMFNRCQIHIMPTTRQEGLPLTILEGMSYGLATIASDIGGISGVITHEFDGLLIKPGNVDELTSVLVKIINDKEIRISIGQNARGTILEKYSKERMVNETLHEIITVVES